MLDDDGRDQPADEPRSASARWSAATATATRRCWRRSPSTVDVISGGRLDWGIGAGWYENEYRGYGYEFPKPKDRIGMLRETVEIVQVDVDASRRRRTRASYYELSRANCDPKPLQDPHPPSGSAAAASSSRCGSSPATPTARTSAAGPSSGRTSATCCGPTAPTSGATPTTIRMTWSPEVFIRATEAEVDGGRHAQPVGRAGRAVAGRQPRRHARAGRREDPGRTSTSAAAASSRGAPTTPTPRRWSCFATEVMPDFRSGRPTGADGLADRVVGGPAHDRPRPMLATVMPVRPEPFARAAGARRAPVSPGGRGCCGSRGRRRGRRGRRPSRCSRR